MIKIIVSSVLFHAMFSTILRVQMDHQHMIHTDDEMTG